MCNILFNLKMITDTYTEESKRYVIQRKDGVSILLHTLYLDIQEIRASVHVYTCLINARMYLINFYKV